MNVQPLFKLTNLPLISELDILLMTLLFIAILLLIILTYKIKSLQNKCRSALLQNEADSKILYLQSKYASMGETVGNIAHQWKQPLNAIGSIQNNIKAALIFQGEISKEKLLNSVETSFKLLQHLAETIDTFYSFLSQRNNQKMNFTIANELEAVRKITEYSFENSRINLNFELDTNPTIQGNPNEFTHAILNLILNAKDAFDNASVEAPIITVHVSGGEKNCVITVTDNAGGIKLKPTDMVFDLHITTKEDGSGLGLFMTKNIIENRFGGTIHVHNTKDGASFTITLPYKEYGEYFHDAISPEEKCSLQRINQLSHKIIELEEVEKALKKWAEIFEHAQWGIVIGTVEEQTLGLMNPEFARMHGYTGQELIGKRIALVFAPECLNDLQSAISTAHERGYYSFESIHVRKDGSRFPVQIELITVKNETGSVLYRIANVWDITEKKASEERLQLKKFALDHIQDAVFMMDENAYFYYVNEGACTALGYVSEDLLSMCVSDIDPDWPVERWPGHLKMLKKEKNILLESQLLRRDGSLYPVELSVNYFEYNGKSYSMAIARDITERKLLEVQKDNERMKLFFERQLVGMAITSPEKGWINTNEKLRQMLGYTHEELTELTWVDITHPDDIAPDVKQFERLLSGYIEDYMLEKRFIRKDGSIVYTNLAVSCVRNDDGTVNYVLALLENITERKATEAVLKVKTEELQKALEFNEDIINAIPDLLFEISPEGTYIGVWAQDPDLLAAQKEMLLGKDFKEVLPPDVVLTSFEAMKEVDEKGHSLGKSYCLDFPDGKRWFELSMSKKKSTGNYIALSRDITKRKELETLLEKEHKFLIDAQRVAHTGSWHLDIQNDLLSWSDETYRIFELDKEDIDDLHKTFYECVHPDDREMVNAPYLESLKTRIPYEIEHRIIMEDGRIKYVIERCEHSYDNDGTPLCSIGTVQDITERKLIEMELASSHHFLNQLIDSIPDPIFVKDKQHTWVLLNKAFCELIGQSRESLLGKSDYDFFPKEEADVFWEKDEIVFNSNETNVNEEYFTSADGAVHYIQTVKTMFASDSKGEHLVGTIRDMSERKAAEETIKEFNATLKKRVMEHTTKLQEAMKQLKLVETAINHASDAVYIIGDDRSILYVSDAACRMLGYTREEFMGMKVYEIDAGMSKDDIDAVKENIITDKEITFETKHRAKGGYILDVEITVTSFTYDDVHLRLSIVKDISERKQAQLVLQASEQRYKEIFENSSDSIYLMEVTEDGRFRTIAANPAFEHSIGIPLDTLLGTYVGDLTDEETTATVIAKYRRCVEAAKPIEEIAELDLPIGRKKFCSTLIPIKDDTGRVCRIIGLAKDITEAIK